ncbi:MAG: hypothetical protein GY752_11960, partial [bacterium]|nr:hypothetical protein [bacterium]
TDAMMVKVVEFVVTITPSNVCDGFETPFKLDILPAATPRAVLGQLSNIVFTAPTAVASLGNPAGSTTLTFSALDANYEGTITTTNWYSTQAGHCNPLSVYNVGATATFDGDAVATKNNTAFTISSAFGTCIDGESTLDNTFSGSMTIHIANPSAGVFNATLTIGTFVRDMQASSSWTVWANSQYHDMVRDEEQYHEGQWEGTNGNLIADLWDPALILAEIQGAQPYVGATQAAAVALANAAYGTAIANEDTRSTNLAISIPAPGRRCAIETEAKTAAGSSYRVAMPCAYSACP